MVGGEEMRKLPYTPQDDAEIRKGFANGETFGQIAERIGRSRNAVAGQARRMGLKFPVVIKWTPDRIKEASAMMSTHSYTDIGAHFGVSKNSVASMAKRYGFKGTFKKVDVLDADEQQYMLDNYLTKSVRDIGAHLGRSGSTVAKRLKAMGLNQPRSRARTVTVFAKPRTITRPEAAPEIIPDTARPWLTRLKGECNYPYGERGNIHSCCAPVWRGTQMCESHAALCGGYIKVAA